MSQIYEVFVSYARDDRDRVKPWVDELKRGGVHVFFDTECLVGAKNWLDAIVEAIDKARLVILFVSRASLASEFVPRELALSVDMKKTILPILLEETEIRGQVAFCIAGLQRVAAYDPDSKKVWDGIQTSLQHAGVQWKPPSRRLIGVKRGGDRDVSLDEGAGNDPIIRDRGPTPVTASNPVAEAIQENATQGSDVIDVFISVASEDYDVARDVCFALEEQGINVFFSDTSIDRLGNAEYKRVIDDALEQCRHLVVVTSSKAHAEKKWVRYEWDAFAVEQLSGRKSGNLFTFVCKGCPISALPLTLRQKQVFAWPNEASRMFTYLSAKPPDFRRHPKREIPFKPEAATQSHVVKTTSFDAVLVKSSMTKPKQGSSTQVESNARKSTASNTGEWSIIRFLAWLFVQLQHWPRLLARVFGFYLRGPVLDSCKPNSKTEPSWFDLLIDYLLRGGRFILLSYATLVLLIAIIDGISPSQSITSYPYAGVSFSVLILLVGWFTRNRFRNR